MGDETTPDPWNGKTDDSFAWEASCAGVNGEWGVVLDPLLDATYLEITAYCEFRRLMMHYIYFVMGGNRVQPLSPSIKTDLAALEDMIDAFPTRPQVLRLPRHDTHVHDTDVIYYHTSYLLVSDTQPFTRTTMLVHLPPIVDSIISLSPLFKEALIESYWTTFDQLYADLLESYQTWRAAATANLVVPFAHVRNREQNGRTFRPASQLQELLLELQMLRFGDFI